MPGRSGGDRSASAGTPAARRVAPVWVGPVKPLDQMMELVFQGQQPSGKNQVKIQMGSRWDPEKGVVRTVRRFPESKFVSWREAMARQWWQHRIMLSQEEPGSSV